MVVDGASGAKGVRISSSPSTCSVTPVTAPVLAAMVVGTPGAAFGVVPGVIAGMVVSVDTVTIVRGSTAGRSSSVSRSGGVKLSVAVVGMALLPPPVNTVTVLGAVGVAGSWTVIGVLGPAPIGPAPKRVSSVTISVVTSVTSISVVSSVTSVVISATTSELSSVSISVESSSETIPNNPSELNPIVTLGRDAAGVSCTHERYYT